MFKKTILASSIILLSGAVGAQSGYLGLSVGQTDIDTSGFDDGRSIAITGGYKFNENFAIEAAFVDLGDSEDNEDPVWTIEGDGFNLSAVGIVPVNETIDIFGKIGVFMWDLSLDEAGLGEIYSDDGTDLSFGIGASANLTEQFGVVFEYQRFDIDGDASNISIGARLNF